METPTKELGGESLEVKINFITRWIFLHFLKENFNKEVS